MREDFFGMPKAFIDKDACIQCGKCIKSCRFEAISDDYIVDEIVCEGCGECEVVCSVGAVELAPYKAGDMMLYSDDNRVFSTAELKTGSGNSRLIVTEVKKRLRDNEPKTYFEMIDGSPGIGCPLSRR